MLKHFLKILIVITSASTLVPAQITSAIQFYDTTGTTQTAKFGWQGNATVGKFFIEAPKGSEVLNIQNGTLNVNGTVQATTLKGDGSNLTNIALSNGSVTSAKIADSAIVTAKIKNGAITDAKIDSVDWAKVSHKPPLASGTITGITADSGISGGGITGAISIKVKYAGKTGDYGSKDSVARSDHSHDAVYSKKTETYTKTQVDSAIAANVSTLVTRLVALEAKLQYVTCDATTKNIYITSANLNIRSGTSTSDGTANGLGNLVVGYNEGTGSKSGSHNVVIGAEHTYTSKGGIVAGYGNAIKGTFASVLGGYQNTAGDVGDAGNLAIVVGGQGNVSRGLYSTVGGGIQNTAAGVGSTVSGGDLNNAIGGSSVVSGGTQNTASGDRGTVSGGESNTATATSATVSGGLNRSATGNYSWTAGTYTQAQ